MADSKSGGVGFLGLLALLFIGLKLGKVIDWSWWWVTAPLWGGPAIVVAIVFVVLFAVGFWKIGSAFAGLFKGKPIDPRAPNRANLRGR